LPPVQQGREFDSLDTAGNSKTKKKPVEMSFHGAPRHLQLTGNLGVIAALQKQLDNLLFARAKSNSLLPHPIPLCDWHRLRPQGAGRNLSIFHSTHVAILRRLVSTVPERPFPQALAVIAVTFRRMQSLFEKQFAPPFGVVQSRVRRAKGRHTLPESRWSTRGKPES
jgi:hypothetical protein